MPRSIQNHLSNGGNLFVLCALSFLVVAENIHIQYGRLSSAELKVYILCDRVIPSLTRLSFAQERAEHIGYATFAILFAMLDIGFVVVRVVAFVALSGSPGSAVGLALVSMSPSVILPMLTYPARLLKRRRRDSDGEVEMGSGTVVDDTRG